MMSHYAILMDVCIFVKVYQLLYCENDSTRTRTITPPKNTTQMSPISLIEKQNKDIESRPEDPVFCRIIFFGNNT